MKLKNLSKEVKNLDGKNIKDADKNVTVGFVLATLVSSGFKGMKSIDNVRAYQLSSRLISAKEDIEVNSDNVELIKKSVDENSVGYRPVVLGQVLLESGLETE